MGTICLSPAPNLRCVGLSLTQEVVTLVPAALEVIFSLGLAVTGRDAGRMRFILVAESPIYFLLILLSLLNRVVPLFQTSFLAHKLLDILIGAASFIPMFLFMLYLYLFKRSKFFPRLPKRFALVANSSALLVIPVIVITNEIVSFLGISYRQVPAPENLVLGDQVAVGPNMSSFQFGREFLRSISLALFVIYQGITFLVFFVRLASCALAQYNIEDRAASEWEGILFRGLGWLVVGAKISAVESAVGFATTSFGVILTRRVLRMIARACLIIGVIKGPDHKEEFLILDTDKANEFLSGTRKLKLRANISSPQLMQSSMTRRLSAMVSLRQSRSTFPFPRPNSINPFAREQTPNPSGRSSVVLLDRPTRTSSATKSRPTPLEIGRVSSTSFESHVSVVRGHGRAPTLVLHLSPTALASSEMLAAMGTNMTDTATINYVVPDPMPFSVPDPNSAPLPRFTGEPSGYRSGSSSPESEGSRSSWRRERSRIRPSRRTSFPPAMPPLPPNVSRTSLHSPRPLLSPPSPLREPFIWPSTQPEPEPEPTTSAVAEIRPDSGALGRQRSARSRRGASTSTVGDMSIDWIVPESSIAAARFRGIGTAPIRTTQASISAAAVRSSVAIEHHESTGETLRESGGASGGGGSRRERARRDSGVLGVDDLARVRRSVQTIS